jgi:hypothetical protein
MVVSVPPTPVPFIPNFGQSLMPAALSNAMVRNNGLRLQWLQSHVCPCTYSTGIPGSPEPACNTCHGRGRYWDSPQPSGNFIGLITFMHTSEAADEPGVTTDPSYGQIAHAEPTITVPSDIHPVWDLASEYDAFVECDAINRWGTVLTVGNSPVLPYQQNLQVLNVTTYDSDTKVVVPLSTGSYVVSGSAVTLPGYPEGTPYAVEYNASPVWVAFRRAGGLAHNRPFGDGTPLPKRYRAVLLDIWTRARNNGGLGQSASPQGMLP